MKSRLLISTLFAAGCFSLGAQAKIDPQCAIHTVVPEEPACFTGNTNVSTPTGVKAISDLHLGDEVLAVGKDGQVGKQPVTDFFAHSQRLTCQLHFSDGSVLKVTPEHVFFFVMDRNPVNNTDLRYDRIGANPYIHQDYQEKNLLTFFGWGRNPQASLLFFAKVLEGSSINNATRVKVIDFDTPTLETVYNIGVAKDHNYFANGILVHNMK
jgi:hypothetical protein